MKKLVWIVNPSSRPRRVAGCLGPVARILREGGWDVETRITEKAGDPGTFAAEAVESGKSVLVGGGDGTIAEVIDLFRHREDAFGIIPIGTANVMARELGIPLDPRAAARAFLEGTAQAFDVGSLMGRPFLIMASYGFDAFVVKKTSLKLKRFIGGAAYAVTALCGLPFYRAGSIELTFEGEPGGPAPHPPIEAALAIFCNASRYAGDFIAAPDADPRDGMLDVVCFTRAGRIGSFFSLISIFLGSTGRSDSDRIKRVRSRAVRFRTKSPDLFQIDGDPVDGLGLAPGEEGRVELAERAVRIVVPARETS